MIDQAQLEPPIKKLSLLQSFIYFHIELLVKIVLLGTDLPFLTSPSAPKECKNIVH